MNNLTSHLKQLEKEEQCKPKASRSNKITKIRAEINEIDTKKNHEKNKAKSCFFKMISKIAKPSVKLTKNKREKIQIKFGMKEETL